VQVRVIPRNGLGNRLQAITSAIFLSETIGAETKVSWGTEPLFPLEADSIFAPECISQYFDSITTKEIEEELQTIPEFLSVKNEEIFLRGNRLGEQRFMPKVKDLLSASDRIRKITLVAGGQFDLNTKRIQKKSSEFHKQRRGVYNKLIFSEEILDQLKKMTISLDSPYIAVHLRGTDRANQFISNELMIQACRKLMISKEVPNLLIVGDSSVRIREVQQQLSSQSILAQTSPINLIERESGQGTINAILDWLLLKNAIAIVTSEGSTFAFEAAVAGGTYSELVLLRPKLSRRLRNYLFEKYAIFRKFRIFPF